MPTRRDRLCGLLAYEQKPMDVFVLNEQTEEWENGCSDGDVSELVQCRILQECHSCVFGGDGTENTVERYLVEPSVWETLSRHATKTKHVLRGSDWKQGYCAGWSGVEWVVQR